MTAERPRRVKKPKRFAEELSRSMTVQKTEAPFVFYNNRKVEGTKLSQNARQKCARNFKVYSI